MNRTDLQRVVATTLANCRVMRNGSPAISNILDILPQKLRDEVMGDAEDVLAAIDRHQAGTKP